MSLPTLNTPTYNLTIPSTKQRIKYRPFFVKEEKVLLMALESQNDQEIADALKSIIVACVTTKDFNFDKLATFDIEYIFLNIRGKSVGEMVELIVIAPDDGETEVRININIDDVKVKFDKSHSNKIQIDKDLWVEMKYPGLSSFTNPQENIDDTFEFVANSIEKIYNEEDVWDSTTTTPDEFVTFLENMSSKQFNSVQKFFETMPSLKHEVKFTNPNTEVESTYVVEGLANFFG
jgi:hypothetical protein|tara:strand:+ start:3523 stop:4224 length:702 start_codon:yes stop_codon:yes gene_type:complete